MIIVIGINYSREGFVKIIAIDSVGTFGHIFTDDWKKKHDVTVSSHYSSVSGHYDLAYFDWADDNVVKYFENCNGQLKPKKIIVRLRRYEGFIPKRIQAIKWDEVDEVIFNTTYLKEMFYRWHRIEKFKDGHIIPNGTDITKWKFKERKGGNKIAMLAWWKSTKNVFMTLQIFATMPKNYELHLAGKWVDLVSRMFIDDSAYKLGVKDRVFVTDERVDADKYLDDKDYLLQSSVVEGCSNIVMEAMAKGIKPVIFNSIGQQGLYPRECMFNHLLEAREIILNGAYTSSVYRDFVDKNYNRKEMLAKMDALL